MIRSALRCLIGVVLVAGTYWNISIFTFNTLRDLAPREMEYLEIQENRCGGIRDRLLELGYVGNIGFITTRDLKGDPPSPEDDRKWSMAQYIFLPHILVRNNRTLAGIVIPNADPPFVIGDFSGDEPIPTLPTRLVTLYDDGNGLVLFQTKTTQ